MRRFAVLFLVTVLACTGLAAVKKKRPAPRKVVPRITAAQRASARDEIAEQIANDDLKIENAATLAPFYEALLSQPIHILQFGDSHTASDDWVNSMRLLLQTKYGDGGPGFVQAGRPYKGYRRFDAHGNSSPGWTTEGTMVHRGDPNQGMSGVSISTGSANQTVTLSAYGELLNLFYLQQPGGGSVELSENDRPLRTIETSGEPAPGVATFTLTPGVHDLALRTLDRAPVRLFGWTLENKTGVTFETMGINGAQANAILSWDEALWAAAVTQRNPALVTLAYGTNEANSARWEPGQYRADMEAIIQRIRRVAPQAAILMIGPPDCGQVRPLRNLTEVIAMQREIARTRKVAFWDWRKHMGGPGSIKRWVIAGYAQSDYIHMTTDGYRMIGDLVVKSLLEKHDEQAGQSH